MSNIEATLICADKTEHRYKLNDEAIEAGVFIQRCPVAGDVQKAFVLSHQEMAKRGWRTPIFEEVKVHYLPVGLLP
jgi:hypothetical protein